MNLNLFQRLDIILPRQGNDSVENGDAPDSPEAFNQKLKLRIRANGEAQRVVAERAGYPQSTVSTNFNARKVPSEEFVTDILTAAAVSDDEIHQWLGWRASLVAETKQANTTQGETRNSTRGRRLSWRHGLVLVFLASLLAVSSISILVRSPSPKDARGPNVPHAVTSTNTSVETVRPVESPSPNVTLPANMDVTTRQNAETFTDPNSPSVSGPPFIPGQTLTVLCLSDEGPSRGWYYTSSGYYVHPDSVRITDQRESPIPSPPPCSQINIPRRELARAKCMIFIQADLLEAVPVVRLLACTVVSLLRPITKLPEEHRIPALFREHESSILPQPTDASPKRHSKDPHP